LPVSTKPKVFGSKGAKKLKSFKEPERDDGFKPIEHVGKIVVLTVKGVEDVKTNRYGIRPAIKADVQIVEDDALSDTIKNVLIFSAAIVGQLEEETGETIVARITTYESQSGGDAPKLEELDEDELAEVEKLFA
jgi:hypothetical protein